MDFQSPEIAVEEAKCGSSSSASVSFNDDPTIHEIPCVLRHGERLVLKGSVNNPQPIMDYEKARLWFTPRELQMTKQEAQRDVDDVLKGRVAMEKHPGEETAPTLDESTSTAASASAPYEDHAICLRGLELLYSPIRGISPRVTYVDEVLIQQSRQQADRIEDDEAIANAGRQYSKASREEAIERAQDDYLEATRIHALPCYEPPKRRSSLQQARRFLRKTSKGLQKKLSFATSSAKKKAVTTTTYVN